MTSSLVVLTDFFAVTNRALSYAAGLAVPLDASLLLLHVRNDALLAPAEFANRHTPPGEQITERALHVLADDQPVPTEVAVADHYLLTAVREAVRAHHALLVVLGRPGATTQPLELITATAMTLLDEVPCPLLIVPGAGWDSFPPRRLLLAFDGQPFHLGPHQDVVDRLLRATAGTLEIVHVTDHAATPATTAALLDVVHTPAFADTFGTPRVHEVQDKEVAAGVLAEAARQEADMLVVVARHHSLFGSLFHRSSTARLIEQSPIPVLVLPALD
jgi:nucleotide-binding universal stress UspA family protein